MIELETDMWKEKADAYVITTNGDVNQYGEAVMGRGCALEAKNKFPGIDEELGMLLSARIEKNWNRVYDLGLWLGKYRLISFPVKHHWHERADLKLIEKSAEKLVMYVDDAEWERVVIPRPGCGNGSLKWEQVKPILEPLFDDRFVVVHKKESR